MEQPGPRTNIGLGAIVLAGGQSRRMGTSKALLDWHGLPLLTRVTGILRRVAGPVVVVHAAGQHLPPLAEDVELAVDRHPGRGPLEGIAAGMRALEGRAEAAFVSGTDVPFLHPAFVTRVAAALGERDAVLPTAGGHNHPLAAVYRVSLLPAVEELLAADRLRPFFLFESVGTCRLGEEDLVELDSLRNLNTVDEWRAAHAEPEPKIAIAAEGSLRRALGFEETGVRASTLGAALAALPGLQGDARWVAVTLNGEPVTDDPLTPLVKGDRLTLGGAAAGS
ncbi:MAG: molybdenum cofactor guanylyltransferase [Dehalococcoidia bacterium]